jgi:hypothetical protein
MGILWTTSAGTFNTHRQALIQIILPELHEKKTISTNCHIVLTLGVYNIIIGHNILRELGIIYRFQQETIHKITLKMEI